MKNPKKVLEIIHGYNLSSKKSLPTRSSLSNLNTTSKTLTTPKKNFNLPPKSSILKSSILKSSIIKPNDRSRLTPKRESKIESSLLTPKMSPRHTPKMSPKKENLARTPIRQSPVKSIKQNLENSNSYSNTLRSKSLGLSPKSDLYMSREMKKHDDSSKSNFKRFHIQKNVLNKYERNLRKPSTEIIERNPSIKVLERNKMFTSTPKRNLKLQGFADTKNSSQLISTRSTPVITPLLQSSNLHNIENLMKIDAKVRKVFKRTKIQVLNYLKVVLQSRSLDRVTSIKLTKKPGRNSQSPNKTYLLKTPEPKDKNNSISFNNNQSYNEADEMYDNDLKCSNDDKIFSSMSVFNNNIKNLTGSFAIKQPEDAVSKSPNPRSAFNVTPIGSKSFKTIEEKSMVTMIEKNISESQIPFENGIHYQTKPFSKNENQPEYDRRYVQDYKQLRSRSRSSKNQSIQLQHYSFKNSMIANKEVNVSENSNESFSEQDKCVRISVKYNNEQVNNKAKEVGYSQEKKLTRYEVCDLETEIAVRKSKFKFNEFVQENDLQHFQSKADISQLKARNIDEIKIRVDTLNQNVIQEKASLDQLVEEIKNIEKEFDNKTNTVKSNENKYDQQKSFYSRNSERYSNNLKNFQKKTHLYNENLGKLDHRLEELDILEKSYQEKIIGFEAAYNISKKNYETKISDLEKRENFLLKDNPESEQLIQQNIDTTKQIEEEMKLQMKDFNLKDKQLEKRDKDAVRKNKEVDSLSLKIKELNLQIKNFNKTVSDQKLSSRNIALSFVASKISDNISNFFKKLIFNKIDCIIQESNKMQIEAQKNSKLTQMNYILRKSLIIAYRTTFKTLKSFSFEKDSKIAIKKVYKENMKDTENIDKLQSQIVNNKQIRKLKTLSILLKASLSYWKTYEFCQKSNSFKIQCNLLDKSQIQFQLQFEENNIDTPKIIFSGMILNKICRGKARSNLTYGFNKLFNQYAKKPELSNFSLNDYSYSEDDLSISKTDSFIGRITESSQQDKSYIDNEMNENRSFQDVQGKINYILTHSEIVDRNDYSYQDRTNHEGDDRDLDVTNLTQHLFNKVQRECILTMNSNDNKSISIDTPISYNYNSNNLKSNENLTFNYRTNDTMNKNPSKDFLLENYNNDVNLMRNISSKSLLKAMVFEGSQSNVKSNSKSSLNNSQLNLNKSENITDNYNSFQKEESPRSKNTEIITEDQQKSIEIIKDNNKSNAKQDDTISDISNVSKKRSFLKKESRERIEKRFQERLQNNFIDVKILDEETLLDEKLKEGFEKQEIADNNKGFFGRMFTNLTGYFECKKDPESSIFDSSKSYNDADSNTDSISGSSSIVSSDLSYENYKSSRAIDKDGKRLIDNENFSYTSEEIYSQTYSSNKQSSTMKSSSRNLNDN